MSEEVNKAKNGITSIEETQRIKFDVHFFDKLENQTTKLVNNESEGFTISGRNGWYNVYFKDPVFVQDIWVDVDGYSTSDRIKFEYESINNNKRKPAETRRNDEQQMFGIRVNNVLSSFRFKPPRKLLANPKIKSIRVYGLNWDQFDEICGKLLTIEKEKTKAVTFIDDEKAESQKKIDELLELETKSDALSTEIENRKSNKEELNSDIVKLTQSKAELDIQIQEFQGIQSRLESSKIEVERDLTGKNSELDQLLKDIQQKSKEVKTLKDNINMFPTDFKGFVEQGGKNNSLYIKIAAVPIILILTLAGFLFWGGADLSAKYEKMPTMDLYTMLGSRVPFMTISIAIIIACYKLTKFLVREIMRINRQRLNLQKISIIANDVSNTSMVGLDFSEKEEYELKTKLKMNMIRSHLKTYLDDEFNYHVDLSLLGRFKDALKLPKLKAEVNAKDQTATVTVDEET